MKSLLLLWTKHASFFVMLASSVALYASNMFLAGMLSLSEYGYYALIISFLSVASSLSLGGFDQAIVRTAQIDEAGIRANFGLMVGAAGFGGFFAVSSYAYFSFFNMGSAFLVPMSGVFVSIGLFGYGIGRLRRYYVFSQFSHGGYRIFFGCGVFFLWIFGEKLDVVILEYVMFASTLIVAMVVVVVVVFRLQVRRDSSVFTSVAPYAIGYMFSMVLMNAIGFGDRFLVERVLGLQAAAIYFFYANIYIFPFSLLQGYVGFKELSRYREFFSIDVFNNDLMRLFKLFLLFMVGCLAADYALSEYIFPRRFEFTWIDRCLLICLGALRLFYGLLSAAFGALAQPGAIWLVNGITLFALTLVGAGAWILGLEDLSMMLVCFLIVWFVRSISVYIIVCKRQPICD